MGAVELDRLDEIAAEVFEGYVVRKDLALKFKGQYPVPTYVGEFLLGRYCASTDEEEIAEGLAIVERSCASGPCAPARRSCSRPAPARRARSGSSTSSPPASTPRPTPTSPRCPSLRLNDVRIEPELVADNERMLTGGFYAEIELGYDAIDRPGEGRPPLRRRRRSGRSSSPSAASWTTSPRGRERVHHRGVEATSCCAASASSPSALSERAQDVLLLRMVPFVERNYNMVELGPRGTGKSHLFQQVSPYSHLVSGGKATVARMFVNNATGQRGLVAQYDVVCFDEVSGVSFDQKDGVNIMKGYMESGEF